jgi:hypothetical protein
MSVFYMVEMHCPLDKDRAAFNGFFRQAHHDAAHRRRVLGGATLLKLT